MILAHNMNAEVIKTLVTHLSTAVIVHLANLVPQLQMEINAKLMHHVNMLLSVLLEVSLVETNSSVELTKFVVTVLLAKNVLTLFV